MCKHWVVDNWPNSAACARSHLLIVELAFKFLIISNLSSPLHETPSNAHGRAGLCLCQPCKRQKNLTACFAGSSVQMLNKTSALSKIQNVGAGPGSTRLQATFAAMACIQLNLACHRIKLTSAPKAKFISNPTVASPSVAAHRQRPH